jgi:hypothetical protein
MFGNASIAGCCRGLPRIEYFAKCDLDSAISRRHLEDSLFRHAHRLHLNVFGAWRPKLSGVKRQGALYCVFAKYGRQTGEYAPGPSNIREVAWFTVTAYVCLMFVNASSGGCGGRAPCIAYSQNTALKPAITPQGPPIYAR